MLPSHRQRVQTALNFEQPDRPPMQISFTPEFAQRLHNAMGLTRTDLHNPIGGGNTYILERMLDQDMLLTSVGWANCYYQDADDYTDEWGIGWKSTRYNTKFGIGRYTEIAKHPLADDTAIDSYQPPDPNRHELYTDAQLLLDNFKEEYWIVGVTVCTIFETAWALRGFEKMLTDLAFNPDLAECILNIPYGYHLTAAKKLVRMGVDMIWIGDDVGAQNAMLISPQQWRKIFKPKMANFIQTLKNINSGLKVAYHSDGNIYPIIGDLIEIGLDILNPVQPASMNPADIKKEFGNKLSFWGTIDEQHTLPFGSPQDVQKEVRQRIQTVGKKGGFIISPAHHVQLDTPLENFWAMVKTVTGKNFH